MTHTMKMPQKTFDLDNMEIIFLVWNLLKLLLNLSIYPWAVKIAFRQPPMKPNSAWQLHTIGRLARWKYDHFYLNW